MNALTNFFYLKKSKSMNYHRNLSYLAIKECFKLQKKNSAEHKCWNFKLIYIKKKERKKENRNNHMIIISLLSCKDEFYASFIMLHMFQ